MSQPRVVALLWWLVCSMAAAQPVGAAPYAPSERASRLIARGELLREAGDTVSALAYFRDAISAAPRRAEGYVALGGLYLSLDERGRALEVFEAGTRWAPGADAVWLGLASTLRTLGQDERALETLRQLRRLDPTSRAGLAALADATEARGSFVEALAARRALLALLAADVALLASQVQADPSLVPPGAAQAESSPAQTLAIDALDTARAALAEQRARVRALEILLGDAERVRARSACALDPLGVVQRALARCP